MSVQSPGERVPTTLCPAAIGVLSEHGLPIRMRLVPVRPSIVAVMVTGAPIACAVTTPPSETEATVALELDQLTARPDSCAPAASKGVAVSCTVAPTGIVCDAGVTVTDATGGTIVKLALPLRPSLVAVIVTGPLARPDTSPPVDTDAWVSFELAQFTARPVRTFPLPSSRRALICVVSPMTSWLTGDVTTIRATGGGPLSVGDPHEATSHTAARSPLARSPVRERASAGPLGIRPRRLTLGGTSARAGVGIGEPNWPLWLTPGMA